MANENDLVAKIKSDQAEKEIMKSANKLGVPYFDARYFDVPIDLLMTFGLNNANKYKVVPISLDGVNLTVGVLNYNKEIVARMKEIELELGYLAEPNLISNKSWSNIYSQFDKVPKKPAGRPVVTDEKGLKLIELKLTSLDEILPYISQKDTEVSLLNLLSASFLIGSSDIHMDPETDNVPISLRIDGVINDIGQIDKKAFDQLLTRIKFYAGLKLNVPEPQDGRIQGIFDGKEVDFRIGTMPTIHGESVVIRVLRTEAKLLTLEELGFIDYDLEILKRYIDQPKGMILTTGPTGSGKTTTLYALLNILNKPDISIVTIEDPVEYLLPGITQSQINERVGYDFPRALRASLRHDPDVIMIGEIRDSITAETAFRAALTGHIALSTYHASEAVGVIPSMIEMGVRPFLAVSALNLIIAQRLVRKICQFCKKEKLYGKEMLDEVTSKINQTPEKIRPKNKKYKFFMSTGCEKCHHLGYQGQVGIYELLEMKPDIIKLSTANIPLQEIQVQALKNGMITMEQDGYLKALDGITTLEEVWRVIGTE